MHRYTSLFSRAAQAILVLSLFSLAACEQDYKDDSKVLVKVNDEVITENAYQHYRNTLQTQQQTVIEDNDRNRTVLLEQMVFNRLMVQEAQNQKLPLNKDIHYAIELQRDEILIGAVAQRYLQSNPVTDADIKARYDELKNSREFFLRHILVADEAQAQKIITELKAGKSFSSMARKYSSHEQSRNKGGELGWVGRESIVPAIYLAANNAGKPGLIDKPVQSKFGWHVVSIDKLRAARIPPLEKLRPAIENQLQREKVSELGRYLRKGGKVEYIGTAK
jgi:peptidyl-prolyl cis-trans isomerase C